MARIITSSTRTDCFAKRAILFTKRGRVADIDIGGGIIKAAERVSSVRESPGSSDGTAGLNELAASGQRGYSGLPLASPPVSRTWSGGRQHRRPRSLARNLPRGANGISRSQKASSAATPCTGRDLDAPRPAGLPASIDSFTVARHQRDPEILAALLGGGRRGMDSCAPACNCQGQAKKKGRLCLAAKPRTPSGILLGHRARWCWHGRAAHLPHFGAAACDAAVTQWRLPGCSCCDT
nr:uncharacterized protein LOC119176690 [Rhipicephalus microplus]